MILGSDIPGRGRRRRRTPSSARHALAAAVLGAVALACGRGCAIDDGGQSLHASQPYQPCIEQWAQRDVPPPDGSWFGCAKEYCFDGRWLRGDQCPAGWPELGLFGPTCRGGCAITLPCEGFLWGRAQCCDLVCASASAPDAATWDDSGADAGPIDAAGDAVGDADADAHGGDVDVIVDAGPEAESD